MKNTLLCLLFFVGLLQCSAQDSPQSKVGVYTGYFGETLTHAGLNLGIEFYPHQSETYQMVLSLNGGGYVHVRNNKSFFVRGQWGQRAFFKNGLFVDQFLGVGYLHQFTHGGELYEVLPNGAVVKTPDSGQPFFMPSVSFGAGYDFSKKGDSRLSVYLRPELFWKAPFNGYFLTHIALNTGIILKL